MKKTLFAIFAFLISMAASAATTTTIWTGNEDLGSWNGMVSISKDKFYNIAEGDKVVVHLNNQGGAQLQFAVKIGNDWTWTQLIPYVDVSGSEYTFDIKGYGSNSVSDVIDALKNKDGLFIKGQKATITKVDLVAESSTGGGNEGGNEGGDEGGGEGGGDVTPVDGSFHINGNKLLDANGNEFIMRGVNFSWAWQAWSNGETEKVIAAAKRHGFNSIRIQIADGGHSGWKKPSASDLEYLIKLCEQQKLIAIFNTHDETGSNNISDLERAANYWISVKDVLNKHLNTVIVNISNEWCGEWSSSLWAEGYTKVIPMMRNAGIKNTLMVDAAGWGQYPKSIKDKGADVYASDAMKNMMYSVHMYENCAAGAAQVKNIINYCLNVGIPLCIGEFGYNRGGNDIAWQTILDYCQEKSVGWLAWSWTGNGGSDSTLDMFSDYDGNNMLENGRCIINGTNGVKETSKECSIFNTSGIENTTVATDAEIISTEYFAPNGMRLSAPQNGMNIVRYRYSNGKTVTKKVIL